MEIMNLEVNILYFLCSPVDGAREPVPVDTVPASHLFDAFADIPAGSIEAVLRSMAADRLITMDPGRARIGITANGIQRLQASIACRIHRFENCRCGAPS